MATTVFGSGPEHMEHLRQKHMSAELQSLKRRFPTKFRETMQVSQSKEEHLRRMQAWANEDKHMGRGMSDMKRAPYDPYLDQMLDTAQVHNMFSAEEIRRAISPKLQGKSADFIVIDDFGDNGSSQNLLLLLPTP